LQFCDCPTTLLPRSLYLNPVSKLKSTSYSGFVRLVAEIGGLGFFLAAVAGLLGDPDLRSGGFALQSIVIGAAAAGSRRFAVALPGRGIA